jgi:hypothetical protein
MERAVRFLAREEALAQLLAGTDPEPPFVLAHFRIDAAAGWNDRWRIARPGRPSGASHPGSPRDVAARA